MTPNPQPAGNGKPPRALAFLLAGLAAIGPFAIDTYLPSFPAIAEDLGATQLEVQQTITAYLAPYALMVLWHGALSDAIGRRRALQIGLAIFGLASLGAVFARSIEELWLMRAVQGLCGGIGMVIGRAVIRDLFSGPQAQRLMAHVAILFALSPAIAPILGGWLHTWFGWRAIFVFLALLALALSVATHTLLPETLPRDKRQPLHPGFLLRSYRRVMGDARFMQLALANSFNFSAFFIYVLSAPVFLMQHLGLGEREFAWMFLPTVSGMIAGSWLSGRLAESHAPQDTLRLAYRFMGFAALANVAVNAALPPQLPWTILPLPFYTCGLALAMPSLSLLGLDRYPAQRGLASSCMGFAQTTMNALAAALIAPLLWASPFRLALGQAALLGLGGWMSWLALREKR